MSDVVLVEADGPALGGAVPAGFAAEAVTMASEEHRRRLLRLGEGGR